MLHEQMNEEEAFDFLEHLLGEDFKEESLHASVHQGTRLCRLVARLFPGDEIYRPEERRNVQMYLGYCLKHACGFDLEVLS